METTTVIGFGPLQQLNPLRVVQVQKDLGTCTCFMELEDTEVLISAHKFNI